MNLSRNAVLVLWSILIPAHSFAKESIKPEPQTKIQAASATIHADDAVDPDEQLIHQLQEAENLYKEGLRRFQAGDTDRGRADIQKAFNIVVFNLNEDTLPSALQPQFTEMLEKVRNWDSSDAEEEEEPSGLDVSEDALKSLAAASTTTLPGRDKIKVDADHPITQRFLQIYTQKRPRMVEEALGRSGRYKDMIESALKAKGLPAELFYLVMAESEYKYNALSNAGAAGLWQFMPGTARKYGLEVSYWVDERYHPEKATPAALQYLSDLYQWFGDWNLAVAAYNRGEFGLARDMQFSRSLDFDSLAGRNALPTQTHHYVPKFMACILIGQHPEKYGLRPKYETPEPYDTVTLPRDLDLGVAAKCAQTTEAVIRRLNPHLRTWCTPKGRPDFILRIPKGAKDAFTTNLAKVQEWNPGPTMVRYRVRQGDFLGRIARQHRTTIRSIMQTNKIRNPRLIRPGMVLLIRPGRGGRNRNLD